jgi:nucleoside-diphosphate-sugar epimerase
MAGSAMCPSLYLQVTDYSRSPQQLGMKASQDKMPTIETELETVIITGSSGLIGSAFLAHVGECYRELCLDSKGPSCVPPKTAHMIPCDLTSDENFHQALDEVRRLGHGRIASILHLAAYYSFASESSPLYEHVNVRGTERLLHGLRDFEVEQFIFASTMLVHAPCEPGARINEDWPIKPKWDYPNSKVAAEQLILRERGDVPVVLMRIGAVYDDRCHSIPLAQQIRRIYEKRLIGRLFSGDVRHGVAFLHIEDMVTALVLAVEQRKALPQVATLLIGESETLSYDELQRTISRQLYGQEWNTYQIPKRLAKFGCWLQSLLPGADPFLKPWMINLTDDHYAFDTSRARTLLGWESRRSLRTSLPNIINELKLDPVGWYEDNHLMANALSSR